jgi:hypothetical protein
MATITIPSESAISVRRPKGSRVKFVNQSSVDVYMDSDPGLLNSVVPVTIPNSASLNGTRLAANGGETQFDNYPGVMWFRALSYTSIQVQP